MRNFNKSSKKVFPWHFPKNPGDNLKSAMLELGMDTKNKSFHSLRKTALNRWEKEVGFPEEIRNMLAGNSAAVKKHYYLPLGMQDTINKIDSLKNFSV